MFEIGDKVLCKNASKQPHTQEELNQDVPNWVVKDKIYTVRAIVDLDFVQGLHLEQITNPLIYFKVVGKTLEPSFRIDRFRDLEEDEVESEVNIKEEVYGL